MNRQTQMWMLALLFATVVVSLATPAMAQRYGRRGGGGFYDEFDVEQQPDPTKPLEHDVFTFARVRFDSYYDSYRRPKWKTDYPDSDLNFSFRLQQLTALKVNPKPVVVDLTDPGLFNYPFIYMCEPGRMILSESEVKALRRYLQNGGFLMCDDFWGEDEYYNLTQQLRRVFPQRKPIELPLDHEIFNCVYKLTERPQVPSIHAAWGGRTYEGYDGKDVHYQGIFDDTERIMVLICHNTDLGDGWEREGVDEWYFREFSEKKAYPLGINIITYAMTH